MAQSDTSSFSLRTRSKTRDCAKTEGLGSSLLHHFCSYCYHYFARLPVELLIYLAAATVASMLARRRPYPRFPLHHSLHQLPACPSSRESRKPCSNLDIQVKGACSLPWSTSRCPFVMSRCFVSLSNVEADLRHLLHWTPSTGLPQADSPSLSSQWPAHFECSLCRRPRSLAHPTFVLSSVIVDLINLSQRHLFSDLPH